MKNIKRQNKGPHTAPIYPNNVWTNAPGYCKKHKFRFVYGNSGPLCLVCLNEALGVLSNSLSSHIKETDSA